MSTCCESFEIKCYLETFMSFAVLKDIKQCYSNHRHVSHKARIEAKHRYTDLNYKLKFRQEKNEFQLYM